MPIKTSPVDSQFVWAPWGDVSAHTDDQRAYATPAYTHASFDETPRDEFEFTSCPKDLKVFTSSKKDDDGEFRKGQQFYLNIQLNEEDRERYNYLRIPTENIVLPCRADTTGRITINASGKRSAETMSMPTSAQEEDVLSLKLTTYLEPDHRVVVPCGRCKDKTPEILRFHPGVNGKPMIDENGMVALRNGQVKLIASAWCASTSHHRGPGTKFSFDIELTSMAHSNHTTPVLVYQGRSDEEKIYASHGRDKGSRSMSKHADKSSKSQSPPLHESGSAGGPPSPAKTSSPPGSPSSDAAHYDMGPVKKRREESPMSPPLLDSDLPPAIKNLEPRSGPICQENHVIIIGQNFSRGMTPMFGREYGKVIEINPFYIECTTPRYPKTEIVPVWIHHNGNFLPSDKTYEFTNELPQSELEQMLKNLVSDAETGNMSTLFSLFGRIPGLSSSTDISSQSQTNGTTMLHNSVMLGYQAGVDILIEEGIELDIEDDTGMTALDYAIHMNNVEITSALLYAGSMLSYERLDKLTLHPSPDMIALLKDVCGVDLPVPSESAQGHVPDFIDLVEEEATSSSMNVRSSSTESHIVPGGNALVIETITEDVEPEETTMPASEEEPLIAPSNPSSSPPSTRITRERVMPIRSSRPMSIATVMTQSTGMVSLAPTMSTMAPSATSSMQSRSSHSMGTRPPVHAAKGGQENIWQCAKKGNLALVKHHLEKELTLINTPWKFDGRSVLMSACASCQPQELVEYLVQCGAQVNCADSFYKRTPLHVLCEEGGLCQDDWRTAVSQADRDVYEQDVLATMRFLLDRGANVDAKNHWKETALMRLFAGRDCPLMVQELYSRGADSRLKSSKDVYPHGTALSYAAFFGRINSLKWMIENDLLLNDETSIKEAIRWAKSSKGETSHGGSQAAVNASKRKEDKAEAIKLLESWLGESGQTKRRTLAKAIVTEQADGWWGRISGIVTENALKAPDQESLSSSSPCSQANNIKMPNEIQPLWKDVQTLSDTLASGHVSTSSNRTKWNPLTMLRKGT
ncbi:hypothetical protein BGZ65_000734 [Modicella reniformis]|uniref:IPT/TIG domain-containing protein n=1 Tax=Modicella reniformis TaxID=1440133 RepID=A0A9P6SNT0_9FUNG|nr:hypothetical protein BGZ65_000734 [Modicella reniformis]